MRVCHSTYVCSYINLCAGLGSSIEVAIHATQSEYRKYQCTPALDQALLSGGTDSN